MDKRDTLSFISGYVRTGPSAIYKLLYYSTSTMPRREKSVAALQPSQRKLQASLKLGIFDRNKWIDHSWQAPAHLFILHVKDLSSKDQMTSQKSMLLEQKVLQAKFTGSKMAILYVSGYKRLFIKMRKFATWQLHHWNLSQLSFHHIEDIALIQCAQSKLWCILMYFCPISRN